MAKLDYKFFPSWVYFLLDFTKEELIPLLDEVELVKAYPQNYTSYNYSLRGQVSEAYELNTSIPFLNDLLIPHINKYAQEFEFFEHYTVLKNNTTMSLLQPWVNFQKKYEFNPIHNHTGLFSFVIWLEVPYDYKEVETTVDPRKKNALRSEGAFNFHFTSAMGEILTQSITIDKDMIYKGIIFPSKFYHSIYPFYSIDGTRISVSGNFYFDN